MPDELRAKIVKFKNPYIYINHNSRIKIVKIGGWNVEGFHI